MYLQKLEIQGFKSFAQKVTLTFNRGITSVVGPNGSGKSNVADAVRWVLGEQSMKLLRGKKAEDVIFAGSDKKKRLGSAEVSVHFNNEDGRAPIDAAEFAITRRVFRTGESDYLLNNRPTRLTDIALLLAKSNFGQRSYSIIGQGMIDEVLAATPQARKVFFDEAAGVRAFQIKKEQAVAKLDQTRENLSRVDLLVQEIEPRLRSLTRQVKRLAERSEVEQELRRLQHAYYRFVWHDVAGQLEHLRHDHADKEREKKTVSDELIAVEAKLKAEEARKTRTQEFESLQRTYQTYVDEKNALLREQSSIKGKRDAELEAQGQGNVVWLEKKRDELVARLRMQEEELETSRSEHDRIAEQHEAHAVERAEIETQLEELQKRLGDLKKATATHVDFGEISQALESLFASHERALHRLQKSEQIEHVRQVQRELESFHGELKKLLHRVRETHSQSVVREIEACERDIVGLTRKKEEHIRKEHEAASEKRVLEERVFRAEEDKSEIEDELKKIERDITETTSHGPERDTLLLQKEQEINTHLTSVEARIADIRSKVDAFNEAEQKKKDILVSLQRTYAQLNQNVTELVRTMNTVAVEIARLETRAEDLEREMRQEMPLELIDQVKTNAPEQINTNEVYGQILQVKKKLEFIGGIDPEVAGEYEETKSRHDFLSGQLEDLQSAINDLDQAIAELDGTIKKRFDEAFERINREFTIYFKKLFGGGRASLELIKEDVYENEENDEEEDEEEDEEQEVRQKKTGEKVITGVAIYATPPGKKLRSVGALSGGERALTSIALICAIISNNPSPFVVLDEVDAALDEANSERFASIVAELSKKTQFIIITHNRATMEHSSILYGVTMGDDGISKLLSVDVEHAEDIIKQHGNR